VLLPVATSIYKDENAYERKQCCMAVRRSQERKTIGNMNIHSTEISHRNDLETPDKMEWELNGKTLTANRKYKNWLSCDWRLPSDACLASNKITTRRV